MVEWTLAPGCGGAGKVKRAQPVRRHGRAHNLHHIGIGTLLVLRDLRCERRDIDRGIVQQRDRGPQIGRIERRQVALDIHHHPDAPVCIGNPERLENPIRT